MRKRPYYYIVWIEGLSWKRGEKIKSIGQYGVAEYTTKMTEALRVKPEDVPHFKHWLRRHGVTEWTLESAFVKTNYAPKDTIFNVKRYCN
jgi:ribosomal protein S16